MSASTLTASTPTIPPVAPEKYLIAFVIQGDDVFKITADNIIHTTGTANGPAFDAIAKLKAAAALLELTNRHKERPDELRQMARELANEGMKLMARASSAIQAAPPAIPAVPAVQPAEVIAEVDAPAAVSSSIPVSVVPAPAAVVPMQESAGVATPVSTPVNASTDSAMDSPTNSKIALISG
jgi:hypothetical protein